MPPLGFPCVGGCCESIQSPYLYTLREPRNRFRQVGNRFRGSVKGLLYGLRTDATFALIVRRSNLGWISSTTRLISHPFLAYISSRTIRLEVRKKLWLVRTGQNSKCKQVFWLSSVCTESRVWWPKIEKNYRWRKLVILWSKDEIYLYLGHRIGRPN